MDRVTLKESVEKAISYGLAPGTADRIGALAQAGKLGTLLWEWRYGGGLLWFPDRDVVDHITSLRPDHCGGVNGSRNA